MWWRFAEVARDKQEIYKHSLPEIPISDSLRGILNALADMDCRALIVGGAVRDALYSQMHPELPTTQVKDVDIEVYGISFNKLKEMLLNHLNQQRALVGKNATNKGHVDIAGQQFSVIKFTDVFGNQYDFSIPRKDNNTGKKHTDFSVESDPNMTPKQAASRRDFTCNSLAYDPLAEEVHDYFGGVNDLKNNVIRHTSDQFAEDILRVLRGMQFVARFGFDLAPETSAIAREIADSMPALTVTGFEKIFPDMKKEEIEENYTVLSIERIAEEFMKFATKSRFPSKVIDYLEETGWLKFFPQLDAMFGKLDENGQRSHVPQDPGWHPEGNLIEHTRQTMDSAAAIADREGLVGDERAAYILAAMLHDVAKAGVDSKGNPITQLREKGGQMRWTSHGHEQAGGPLSEEFLQSIGIKQEIVQAVKALIENHLGYISYGHNPSDKAVNNLAKRLHLSKTSIERLMHLVEADQSGRVSRELEPDSVGRPIGLDEKAMNVLNKARELGVHQKPMQPFIQGRDIQALDPLMPPGPLYGQIINKIYGLQTSGVIKTKEQALQKLSELLTKRKQYLPAE